MQSYRLAMQCRLAACQAAIEEERGGRGEVELKKVLVEVISFQRGAASNWHDTKTHIYKLLSLGSTQGK